jgi:hypothetical protein
MFGFKGILVIGILWYVYQSHNNNNNNGGTGGIGGGGVPGWLKQCWEQGQPTSSGTRATISSINAATQPSSYSSHRCGGDADGKWSKLGKAHRLQ